MRGLEQLVVDRPLAFLDLETTGVSVSKDRIVEIGLVIVYPVPTDGSAPEETFIKTRRINPGIPIPKEATAVHGIKDEDVRGEASFKEVAHGLWTLLDPCDLAGFNMRAFDLPLLQAEFKRLGMELDHRKRRLIDVRYLYAHRERRDLSAAVQFYLGRPHADAHSAGADTIVLMELLEAQLRRYEDLPCDMDGLHKACDEFSPFRTEVEAWFGDDLNKPVFQRGKCKDRSLDDVIRKDADYIGWMLGGAKDMDEEVKDFIRQFRKRLDYSGMARAG